MIRVCLLWHMHQPFYKDLLSRQYRMPWTRLHALKDYFGMVEMTREFPALRLTFNLVPSLIAQIEDYATGAARDPLLELAQKPADQLSREERLMALANLFQADPRHLIARYPRYERLFTLFRTADSVPERALSLFTTSDFADLLVLSQLAWFDEIYLAGDAEIRALVEKGEGYGVADQQVVARKQRELLGRVVGAYREAQDRGQVELSTTPYYHPILPLVCDTNVAEESRPGMPLPRRFRYPQDARLQLERAIAKHTEVFGRPPAGLWPSEGSVSDQVLAMAADLGFRWAASGEGVLARSLACGFPRDAQGVPANAAALYGSYEFAPAGAAGGQAGIRLFFRDHCLSDLIGFVYSNMDPEQAARDLLERLRRCGRAACAGGRDPVVSVILDGENAWEHYSKNGRAFLACLYAGLSSDPELRPATFSEALELEPRGRLAHVVPGSWINANFDIWIGAGEDNRAWNLLNDARAFFAAAEAAPGRMSREQLELAREELLIAEGSDWNWWFGPEHHTINDRHFDELYRTHLANVYRALGAGAPDSLAVPIARHEWRAFSAPPRNYISPRIDGLVSSYFEWMGAGVYSLDQRGSAMHGRRFYVQELHYGTDPRNFYLRLDLSPEGLKAVESLEVRVNVTAGEAGGRLIARVVNSSSEAPEVHIDDGAPPAASHPPPPPEMSPAGAFRRVLELRLPLAWLGLDRPNAFRFQVQLWESGLPVDLLPADGWLEVEAEQTASQW